jgi:sterol desaturase/sphingolipid hydroxylase (fatty acid hydroxylase superfamily)
MIFNFFAHVVCYDAWFYVSHLFLHRPAIYSLVHHEHHATSYLELDYTSTQIGHWMEHAVQPLGIFIPLLFGQPQLIPFAAAVAFVGARGAMRHDHRFTPWIGNHHLLHHKYPRFNFGEYWIDSFFGTRCPYADDYEYGQLYT